MNLKRKIRIAPEKRKRKGKEIIKNVPVRIRVSYTGNRVDLFSGFRIDLDDWDEVNSRVKENRKNGAGQSADEINLLLNGYENDLSKFFFSFSAKDAIPTPNQVKDEFQNIREKYHPEILNHRRKNSEVQSLTFFEVFDEFTEYTGKINNWTNDTYVKFSTLRMHLHNFNEELTFEELTDEGLSDLLAYFMNKQKMRNTTTKKYFEFITWFLRYALAKKHTDNDAFLHFKPKLKRTKKKIIFLTEDEINQIREAEIPEGKEYLKRVRDVLIFLCYSGLRHSDVYKLKKSDIKNGKFEVTTKKTNDSLVIELNKTTRAILKKYEEAPLKRNKALPVISNQKMNEYLKELGELAEINEPITQTYFIGNKRYDDTRPKYELLTTHIGRRSFICLCIAKGIPIQVIMKWTGHSDYKAMKPYIEVSGKTKETEMKKLNF